jgi:hypothetical protein
MNLKQLGILIAIVVVIGGAVLVLHDKQKSSWSGGSAEAGKKLLGELPVNDIAHVEIQHGTNVLNLVKKDDLWRVRERADYPANFSQISEFLLKARDLKVVQSEEIGASQLPRMELAPGQGSNSPVTVNLKDQGDKIIRTLLLGKLHMKKSAQPSPDGENGFPDGRWVKVGADSPNVALIADPLENIDTKPDQWINKDFFRVEKPKTIEVDFPVATNSWKLTRESETADWKLAGIKSGEELDSSKSAGVTSPFSSPSFNDVMAGAKLDEGGSNKPTAIKIETFDSFDYTVKVGAKTNDDYFVTIAVAAQLPKERAVGKDEKPDEKTMLDAQFKVNQQKSTDKLKQEQSYQQWTYIVPSWVVDPILKERSQLLVEKKDGAKPADETGETNKVESAVPAIN